MQKNYWEWEPAFPLLPEETALLIIDMQRGFVEEGALLETPMARRQVPSIAKLLSFCRTRDIPVIHTAFCFFENFTYDFYWKMAAQRGLQIVSSPNSFAPGTPETEIIPALRPLPDETVIQKYGYDCFAYTDLDRILKSLGRKTLLIAGTVINWCVDSTVRGAYHKNYNVAVMSDCVSAFSHANATAEQWYHMELDLFAEAFGRVLSSNDAMEELLLHITPDGI